MKTPILIIAGEASGDNVGGSLAAEMKLLRPDYDLFGLGGDRMDISGVDILYHINQLSFLGYWEVVKHIPFIKQVEKDILKQLETRKPSLAILIDYPGFNLRLAAKLKAMNIPIMYYVSPQVWAWGKKRVAKIKKLVDLMVVIFEFEREIYEKGGVPVRWHGHPLLEIVKTNRDRDELTAKINLKSDDRFIGLFPGSRKQEIEKILPVMRDAVGETRSSGLKLRGMVGCAPGLDDSYYKNIGGDDLIYTRGMTYDLMEHADLNLVASGTATLECAILGRPLFVLYKTSLLTYLIARSLIKIPHVGLVNVVAGEKIVPEFIQGDCRNESVAAEIKRFFSDESYRNGMNQRLSAIKGMLGDDGASKKVAETVISMIESST
ncbi:MAG: lipid-A-disaccharide synthase [candidate division Zixibacteria bacterium]